MKILDGKQGLVILLVAFALGYFVISRKSVRPDLIETRTAAGKVSLQSKQIILEAPTKQDNFKALEQARRNYNIVVLNGITKVPSSLVGNKIRVTIQPKPEAQWCKTGDFDLIKSLAENTKDRVLTLSLESIGKDGVKRSQTFSLSELNGDKPVVFDIPSSDGAYGLYLCSDQSKTASCAKKEAIPAEIWSATPDKVKKLGVDKVFYFQLLHVKDKTLNVIPSNAWGKANIKGLKSRLGNWMGDDVDALEKMDALVSKIMPMPARLSNSKIEIPLPYNDLRCLGH